MNKKTSGRNWRIKFETKSGMEEIENLGLLDEVVIDEWLHIEQMEETQWWLRVGNAKIWVTLDPEGNATVSADLDFY